MSETPTQKPSRGIEGVLVHMDFDHLASVLKDKVHISWFVQKNRLHVWNIACLIAEDLPEAGISLSSTLPEGRKGTEGARSSQT